MVEKRIQLISIVSVICYLCLMDQVEGHDTVSSAAERTERQRELEGSRLNIQQRIQARKKDVKLLHQQVEAINLSADETVGDSEKTFTELSRLLTKRSSDVKQQVRSRQRSEVSRVRELQEKLEQEITELKRNDAELQKLSHTEDLNQFLLNTRPLRYFKDVTAAVSQVRDELQKVVREKLDVLLPPPEPTTRAEFLKYSSELTLDPNTANTRLRISDGNKNVTLVSEHQSYSNHPDRFTEYNQVLSRESLTGRCYWEVEWRGAAGGGPGGVYVAAVYKNISRDGDGDECGFGLNENSWSFDCDKNGYNFMYNNIQTLISGAPSSRVGVYLDHTAGVLSFYSVSDTMTLLHRVQTSFTQPLYAGLSFLYYGSTAELCNLK